MMPTEQQSMVSLVLTEQQSMASLVIGKNKIETKCMQNNIRGNTLEH